MMRTSMVSRRRILPTYLAQQCLHLVGVTLNREQQIRVAGAGGAGCLRFKLKPTYIGECTAHTINFHVSLEACILYQRFSSMHCILYQRHLGFRLHCFAH